MRRMHYLALEDRAHRGTLERGLRYVFVHTMRSANEDLFDRDRPSGGYPRFAYEGLVLGRDNVTFVGFPRTVYRIRQAMTDGDHWNHERFAGDAGLWDDPGASYRNNTNYTLDVHALLREGIVIEGATLL